MIELLNNSEQSEFEEKITQPDLNSKIIHVLGLGVAENVLFSSEALNAFKSSDIIIGSERQLAVVKMFISKKQQLILLPKLKKLKSILLACSNQSVVILASGDPLFFGIGSWLKRQLGVERLRFYPAVSSIQAACHKVGLPIQDCQFVSLHGRPLETIRTQLKSNVNLVVLTDKNSHPQYLAKECALAGFADSIIWVCENLGYPQEKISKFYVSDLIQSNNDSNIFDVAPLHVSVIEVKGEGNVLPEFPGIPTSHFVTDGEKGQGLITKREVRLVILSLLQASNQDVIWDIGAGCGGVSIELAYWNKNTQVYAIEHHKKRLKCLNENKLRFGVVKNLKVIEGYAPESLKKLPKANKIFIGGSDGYLEQLLKVSWQQLPQGGLLIISTVTENNKNKLLNFIDNLAPELLLLDTMQVAVSQGKTLAGQLVYQPNLPVTLFKLTKLKHNEY
ncbi:precorrin-6y C5,15-methyltransferase (decarboxylating) subunit CbiE [Aliikangiella sp. IMCC44359]|uniref:precorrin-6y C5,15-methyltransferase (decarboxylating) subunit CbiE n=1 Tax=Aliikangiella sp. IMCC44359 TaxID=3459125 RepID=UPI00403B1B23